MSSASMPEPGGIPSAPAPAGPSIVPPGAHRRGRMRRRMVLAAVVVVAASAAFYWNSRRGSKTPGQGTRSVAAVAVAFGDVEHRIRVSGSINAENFAALLAPQIRGSRNDRGRGSAGNSKLTSVSATPQISYSYTVASSSGGSASSGSSSSSSEGDSDSLGGGNSQGSSGGSRGSSGGRGGGSRFSDTGSAASASLRIATSIDSGGGGGGGGISTGGGRFDFMLVLLKTAKPGSLVKKGDVVAEFDRQYQITRRDDYRISVNMMEANIRSMKAQLDTNRKVQDIQVKAARATYDKTLLDLKTVEVRSAIDSERFRLAAEEAKARCEQIEGATKLVEQSQAAQIKAAEIDLNQAKIELRRTETNADRMILKAPMDGIVVMQSIFRGGEFGQIRAGDQVASGQFFMSIVDPRSMVINATVNQADSEQLRLGMKAHARVDAYTDIRLPATLVGVGALSKTSMFRAGYVGEIPIRLKLEQIDARVIPDLSASAEILLRSERQTTIMPRAAVFQDGGESNAFVFLRGPEGWLRRPVEVGTTSNVLVAVKSGVQKGDVVALQRPD
jgi:HlyD family secretion protein